MSSLPDRFDVVIRGNPVGPFSLDELRRMNLGPTDFVKPSGYPEFKEVREIAELSNLLNIAHQTTRPQYFATLDVRLLATAIDYFIACCIYAALAAIYIAGMPNATENIPALLVGLVTVPPTNFIVCVATEGQKQQTYICQLLIGQKFTHEQTSPT